MPTKNILTAARYTKLLKDVRRIIEEGKMKAEQAARRELVITNWKIGERVDREKLTQNASYGEAVLRDFSEELGIDLSTLKRCISFFKHTKVLLVAPI